KSPLNGSLSRGSENIGNGLGNIGKISSSQGLHNCNAHALGSGVFKSFNSGLIYRVYVIELYLAEVPVEAIAYVFEHVQLIVEGEADIFYFSGGSGCLKSFKHAVSLNLFLKGDGVHGM